VKRIIYTVVFAVLVSGLLSTCGDPEPEESCDGVDLGDQYCSQLDIEIIATFCSDGENNSYYAYNNKNYTCDGVAASTCGDALDDIAAQIRTDNPGCSKKNTKENMAAIKTKLSETAEKLLRDVRLKSMDKGL
jgi:hypothetical protein